MKAKLYTLITFTLILQFCYFASVAQVITTVVGGGGNSSAAQATQVVLGYPFGVALDSSGNLFIACIGSGSVRKLNTSGIITTVAGGGTGTLIDGGSATNGKLKDPVSVAIDASGNLYISELSGNKVWKVSTGGIISTVAGTGSAGFSGDGGPAISAQLNSPSGLVVDGLGNLFIADLSNHRIREVSTSGIITTVAGNGINGYSGDGGRATAAELNFPRGIALDSTGNIFIIDQNNDRIREVSDGIINTVAGNGIRGYGGDGGPAISAQLNNPEGLSIDGSGNLFITTTGDGRVRKVDNTGTISTIAGTGILGFGGDGGAATNALLNGPVGIVVKVTGDLFIADENNLRIRQISKSGIINTIAGIGNGDGGLATSAIINQGTGGSIYVDASNNTFINDASNRIRKVNGSTGIITTIAGDGTAGFSGDGGAATSAQINSPFGIYEDISGNVYFDDNNNFRIRKINTSGIISTVAGTGSQGYTGDGGAATLAKISFVQGITGDASGNIYFADFGDAVIRKIDTLGIISTIAGTGTPGYTGDGGLSTAAQLGAPNSITFDAAGNYYIGDDNPNSVRRVNKSGIISTIAGGNPGTGSSGDGGPATSALFCDIESAVTDSSGNIYIADACNNKIRKVQASTGIVTTIAGTGIAGYTGDGGSATTAMLQSPWGLSIANGNLYIADVRNNVIRKVSNVVAPAPVNPTKLGIKSFAIFAGDSTASLTDSVHYGVEIGSWSGSHITGNIGSNTFIQFTNPNNLAGGSFIIEGNIYGNVVRSTGIPTISGNVSVLNKNSVTYNVLNMTLGSVVNPGNIFVNGNAFTNSRPAGIVQIPANYTYTGPIPGGGIDTTRPVFPQMPDFPPVSNYAVPSSPNITNTQTIVPGSYGNIVLNGGDTITFSGVGTYVFAGANITNANNFVYDFKNNTTGGIQIIFTQDANLGNLVASTINGGSPSRIFTEAKGRGSSANNFSAFAINTTGGTFANWVGTVYAPYAAIAGGNVDPQSVTIINGCLWSTTKITLGPDIGLFYAPPAVVSEILPVTDIIPYYPAPADGKVNTAIGSELTSLYENQGTITTDSIIYRIFGNQVLIDVIARQGQYTQTLNFLLANGLNGIINNGEGSLIITGKFPIANLLILNTRPDLINYARPLYFPLNNTGIVESQGDSAIQSNFVRKAYGLSGQGVKVGVLSDSYNSLPGNYAGIDIANGDLPGTGNPYNHLTPVQVLEEYPYGQSIDEGRAMLEIVHDIAPNASLAFRTGFTTAGDFALGIGELQSAGCNVIVDDITFITEPYFKDGVVAHAVDNAVAAGSTYFSAAGNFGMKSYEGNFSGITALASLSGITVPVHDFGSGNPLQTLNLQPGNYTIVLQWDDNIYSMGTSPSGASTDLDIYLVDNFGSTLFGFNRNNLGADPLEVFPFTVTKATTANLLIAKAAGPDVHFKYIVFRGNLTINGYSGSSTLVGQANSAGAIAVGAALYVNTPPYNVNPPTISSFSSVGGTIVEGTVRNKPDIVAPQGINTTVDFGALDYERDNFANFYGTSASAPHAAAAAALIIEGQQKFIGHAITPAETRTLLESTALDMNTPGFDAVTGYGFIQPMTAMETFATPKPIIIALQTIAPVVRPVSVAFTVIVKGKFLTPQTLVYLRGVPIATNFLNTDSVSAVIPPFTDNPVVQLYNPPITSSLLDGGLSDSMYFFPKKLIVIRANDQTKKYGAVLPNFTSTITVDGVPLTKTLLTLDDLKLNPLLYTSSATQSSNIATYFIHPYNILDPHDPTDSLLLHTYTYEFIDGLLTVTKLPIKITPRDTTLVYGQQIHGIRFNYVIDSSAIIGNKDSLISTIRLSHTSAIIDSVYVLTSKSGATSRPLVNSDLDGLGILISNRSGTTSRPLVNNGSGTPFTSYVVDIDNQSIFNYQANPSSSPLVNSKGATSRALVNTGPLINGTASVIVNGAGVTSRALVNGDPLLLDSTTTGSDSISNIAVIVSSADVPGATTNRIFTLPVNLVTGITVGQNIIAPAAFISGNFDVTYGLGNLTITPAPLLVTANSASTSNGQLPPFSATIQGFQYQDSSSSPRQGPQFTLLPAYSGNPGTYAIRPAGLMFPADTNYIKTYIDGVITVFPYQANLKPIALKLKCVQRLCRDNRSRYKYVAHFYYENRNSTSVNIPIGINNKITSAGPYKGNQPSVFNPGINYVDYYFTGEKLTWRIVTPNTKEDNHSEATASSRSRKCDDNNDDDIGTKNAINKENPKDSHDFSFYKLYPNPAHNTVWLSGSNFSDDQKNITIISATGVEYQPRIKSQAAQVIEIDISDLPKGVYFIRIEDRCHIKILPFIKL